MLVPVPWLERMPTYKDKRDGLGLDSYGFLGYPVLQAADILLYRAQWVPVGKDQERHIIFARRSGGRFNHLYGRDVFPLPEALFTEFSEIPGTDGARWSKSYGNDIRLADSAADTRGQSSRRCSRTRRRSAGTTRADRKCAPCSSCTAATRRPPSRSRSRPTAGPGNSGVLNARAAWRSM